MNARRDEARRCRFTGKLDPSYDWFRPEGERGRLHRCELTEGHEGGHGIPEGPLRDEARPKSNNQGNLNCWYCVEGVLHHPEVCGSEKPARDEAPKR